MRDYQQIIAQLNGRELPARRSWICRCPSHDDQKASLELWVSEKTGHLMAKCYAGCSWKDICQALGTSPADWGNRQMTQERRIVAIYDYVAEDGELLYQVVRFEPKSFAQRRPTKNGWDWSTKGVRRVLYHLPALLAKPTHPVIVCEGEKDAENVEKLGLLATTNDGGADKWPVEGSKALAGRRVVLIPDNDQAGRKHVDRIAGQLIRFDVGSLRLLELPGLPEKGDISDWLGMHVGASVDEKRRRLVALIQAAKEWK